MCLWYWNGLHVFDPVSELYNTELGRRMKLQVVVVLS